MAWIIKCLEMTIVVIWRYMNKTELNWIEKLSKKHGNRSSQLEINCCILSMTIQPWFYNNIRRTSILRKYLNKKVSDSRHPLTRCRFTGTVRCGCMTVHGQQQGINVEMPAKPPDRRDVASPAKCTMETSGIMHRSKYGQTGQRTPTAVLTTETGMNSREQTRTDKMNLVLKECLCTDWRGDRENSTASELIFSLVSLEQPVAATLDQPFH